MWLWSGRTVLTMHNNLLPPSCTQMIKAAGYYKTSDYTASHSRRQKPSLSPLWEPQISDFVKHCYNGYKLTLILKWNIVMFSSPVPHLERLSTAWYDSQIVRTESNCSHFWVVTLRTNLAQTPTLSFFQCYVQRIEFYSVIVRHHCDLLRHIILTYCIFRVQVRSFPASTLDNKGWS